MPAAPAAAPAAASAAASAAAPEVTISPAASGAQQQHLLSSDQQQAEDLNLSDPRARVQHLTFLLKLEQERREASLHNLSQAQSLLHSIYRNEEKLRRLGVIPAALDAQYTYHSQQPQQPSMPSLQRQ
jgi:hypothetical protein